MFELDYKKFAIACIIIILIWGSLFYLWYTKADEVTKDPCAICSERMGVNVVCTQMKPEGFLIPATRIYYANGTVYDPSVEYKDVPDKLDFSKFNLSGG